MEMLAIVLEIKKVSYEHLERKFKLITDREALSKIGRGPEFGKN